MNQPLSSVLDASALLAMLHREQGGDIVEGLVEEAVISTVNWSEVYQRSLARGVEVRGLGSELAALGLQVVSFGTEDAERAAELWPATRSAGLSLGDRACLALALRLGAPAVTGDRSWSRLELDIPITTIR